MEELMRLTETKGFYMFSTNTGRQQVRQRHKSQKQLLQHYFWRHEGRKMGKMVASY